MAVEKPSSKEQHVFKSTFVVVPNPDIFPGPPNIESAQKGNSFDVVMKRLGIEGVKLVSAGKLFLVEHESKDLETAKETASEMGNKLLANKAEVFTVQTKPTPRDAIDTL